METHAAEMNAAFTLMEEEKFQEAMALYQKLSALGLVEADVAIADMYQNGRGVDVNIDRAEEIYINAAATGNIWAEYTLACFYEETERDELAIPILRELACEQHLASLNRLGRFLQYGLGCEVDPAGALRFRNAAADQGHIWALKWRALRYLKGENGNLKRLYAFFVYARAFSIIFRCVFFYPGDPRLSE